jgi:hypothetical protein
MIPGLHEIYSFMPDNIYKPMFLRDPSRPNSRPEKFERFRLTGALKWIPHNPFD